MRPVPNLTLRREDGRVVAESVIVADSTMRRLRGLLGKGDHSYYNFLPSVGRDRTSIAYPNMQAPLGAALGPYSVFNGIYTRRFARGNVRVDPLNHSATITVAR